jgi:DNA-3-methyladenine glycosylase
VVCEPKGVGAAVLLRALEPLEGEARMLAHRGGRGGRDLARGPGRLAQALAIGLGDDGACALSGALRLEPAPRGAAPLALRSSTRIGLGKGADLPYRFFAAGSPYVSRYPRAP